MDDEGREYLDELVVVWCGGGWERELFRDFREGCSWSRWGRSSRCDEEDVSDCKLVCGYRGSGEMFGVWREFNR